MYAHISEVMLRKVLQVFCADILALTSGGLIGLRVQGMQQLYDGLRLRIMGVALGEAKPFAEVMMSGCTACKFAANGAPKRPTPV